MVTVRARPPRAGSGVVAPAADPASPAGRRAELAGRSSLPPSRPRRLEFRAPSCPSRGPAPGAAACSERRVGQRGSAHSPAVPRRGPAGWRPRNPRGAARGPRDPRAGARFRA
ncbi:PREDICTED: translation initiation factor IF-2-like [Chinchilla lanigera]|uniref:translation initiation factor IF-2-like n=1 Tax=Chinchilla lanigera TaxID=34839 RepID=UPI00069910FD|nr:PREDICTED: translation initiation factor IF-2-like [Chinchilla lanigera]